MPTLWVRLSQAIEQIGSKPFFIAVRRGLALSLPLIMIGALVQLVRYPPSEGMRRILVETFGPALDAYCDSLLAGTFGIASLVALFGFADVLTNLHNQQIGKRAVNPAIGSMVVTACFFILIVPDGETMALSSLSLSQGLIGALLTASIAGSLFLRLCTVHFLRIPVRNLSNDPLIGDVFTVMPAGMVTILLVTALKALSVWAGVPDIVGSMKDLLAAPVAGLSDSLFFALGYVVASQVLWLFGIHGPNVLYSIQQQSLIPATDANVAAVMAGGEPQFTFTSQFFDFFVRIGGSGSTLCLIFAILLANRTLRGRKMALLMLVPALFNVNEPLLFALPLVLNPVYALPFVVVPVIQTIVCYVATVADLLPKTGYNIPWTTPALYSGFAATGSLAGTLMQAVCLVLGTAIYIPFVRIGERLATQRSQEVLASLLRIAEAPETGLNARYFLDLPGAEGRMAIALASDLEDALKEEDQIFLEYQPQFSLTPMRAFGAEALLRWNHPLLGRIAPPVIVALAEGSGTIDRLGFRVLSLACRQRAAWRDALPDDFVLSVNVSPQQLLDPEFDRKVIEILRRENLSPTMIELEITESTILSPGDHNIDCLKRLRDIGVKIALDDFGMGHTSLHYLRELPLDTVKIDRSLANVDVGSVNEHIVKSIVDLSNSLGISTIVEGVEDERQSKRLAALGCNRFQGYFFSRPLSANASLQLILDASGRQRAVA